MKKIFVMIAIVFMAVSIQAQNWGVGVKFGGWDYGLNIKQYRGATSLEGVFDFHRNGFRATGLYEWNNELGNGFVLYYGLGGSLGMWDENKEHNADNGFGLSINGVIGIEYHFSNGLPLTLALDWTPAFELIPDSYLYSKGLAFSVKYVW